MAQKTKLIIWNDLPLICREALMARLWIINDPKTIKSMFAGHIGIMNCLEEGEGDSGTVSG